MARGSRGQCCAAIDARVHCCDAGAKSCTDAAAVSQMVVYRSRFRCPSPDVRREHAERAQSSRLQQRPEEPPRTQVPTSPPGARVQYGPAPRRQGHESVRQTLSEWDGRMLLTERSAFGSKRLRRLSSSRSCLLWQKRLKHSRRMHRHSCSRSTGVRFPLLGSATGCATGAMKQDWKTAPRMA